MRTPTDSFVTKLVRRIELGLGGLVALLGLALGVVFEEPPSERGVYALTLLGWLGLAYLGYRLLFVNETPVGNLMRSLRRRAKTEATVVDQDLDERSSETAVLVARWMMTLEYEVDGLTVRMPWCPTQAWTNVQRSLDRIERRYPIGYKTLVYFDPDFPANRRAVSRIGIGTVLALVLEPFMLLIFLVGVFAASFIIPWVSLHW